MIHATLFLSPWTMNVSRGKRSEKKVKIEETGTYIAMELAA